MLDGSETAVQALREEVNLKPYAQRLRFFVFNLADYPFANARNADVLVQRRDGIERKPCAMTTESLL